MRRYHDTRKRPLLATLATIIVLASGCAEQTTTEEDGRSRPEETAHAGLPSSSRTFPRDSPTTVVGFGGGSLWTIDYGDYRCDDTPGTVASCHTPETVFLKRLDPDTREVRLIKITP